MAARSFTIIRTGYQWKSSREKMAALSNILVLIPLFDFFIGYLVTDNKEIECGFKARSLYNSVGIHTKNLRYCPVLLFGLAAICQVFYRINLTQTRVSTV